MMIGARQAALSGFRRLIASAMAHDLCVFVLPGLDVARARSLDFGAANLRLANTPRHANVLLFAGSLPQGLEDAAIVAYAQMPRPRTVLFLGSGDLPPGLHADVIGELSQAGLTTALEELSKIISADAFGASVAEFDAPALQTRIEYTCPMHPEVVSDHEGNCPKCGMNLVPREISAGSAHTGHVPPKQEPDMPSKPTTQAAASHDHSKHASAEPSAKYTCPMHPEIVSDAPGSCPKCGMFLEEVKDNATHEGHEHHDHSKHASAEPSAKYTCPMHPEIVSDAPGSCPKCGMFLEEVKDDATHEGHEHHDHTNHASAEPSAKYTCPMHPEIVSDEPGSCPKCGMFLEEVKDEAKHEGHDHHHDHSKHDHSGHQGHDAHARGANTDGIEPQFMSMIELTEGQPVSPDGLIMEWINVPFGPFFPGLPGGLGLDMSLDGDSVANVRAQSLASAGEVLSDGATTPEKFVEWLAAMSPLSPVSYRQLACLALEDAAKQQVTGNDATARVAAVERERIASHMGWLANLGAQTGFGLLERRATNLELIIRDANMAHILALSPEIASLLTRLRKSRMLRDKLLGTGHIDHCTATSGPVARASAKDEDARSTDATYIRLGFTTVIGSGGDAAARLTQRLAEIEQSLHLIAKAGEPSLPDLTKITATIAATSGTGQAAVETPRGAARLTLTLTDGMVTAAEIGTPTAAHFTLIEAITQQAEIADALIAVGSLDLSPWEMRP